MRTKEATTTLTDGPSNTLEGDQLMASVVPALPLFGEAGGGVLAVERPERHSLEDNTGVCTPEDGQDERHKGRHCGPNVSPAFLTARCASA